MHPSLAETAHRPWPVPERRWTWRQSWCDLLFAHWPVPVDVIRPAILEQLEIDTFDGSAWIGLVPFRMQDVMLRGLPAMPGISAFEELNVRTYVTIGGKPGVWFFSLDAADRLAVWAARQFFHLPYFYADMALEDTGNEIRYRSERRGTGGESFEGTYRPVGSVYAANPGSLEHWLTERYCLYCKTPAVVLKRGHVHHRQWPLQAADLEIRSNTLLRPFKIPDSQPPHCLHFSCHIDVIIWPLEVA
jgi:uncharacterized protein